MAGLDWWALLVRPALVLAMMLLVMYDLARDKKPKKDKEAKTMPITRFLGWMFDDGERMARRRNRKALREQRRRQKPATGYHVLHPIRSWRLWRSRRYWKKHPHPALTCNLDVGPCEVDWI